MSQLGLWPFDTLLQPPSEEMVCLNKANASPQVAAIDALIVNLQRSWNPTGFYSIADMQKVLGVLANEAAAASVTLAAAPLSTSTADGDKAQAFDDLLRKYTDQSKNYEHALAQAQAAGAAAVDAPGLKDWVIRSMRAISDAYVTAAVLQCHWSWLESILDRGYHAMAAVGEVAAGVLGVAADVAGGVIHAAEAAASGVAALLKFSKWILILGGGTLAVLFVRKKLYDKGLLPLSSKWQLPGG